MIDLRSLEDSAKISYTVALEHSKKLASSAITAPILMVAVLVGILTQLPIFGLAMVEVNAEKNLGYAFRANPADSQSIKNAAWTLLAFAVVFILMIYVAEFWIIRSNAAPAVNFRLALDWLFDAPLFWFETHVLMPADVVTSSLLGEPININPKLVGIFESVITPMFLLPLLSWIALPYNPQWVIHAILISVIAMTLAMYGMMALGSINLVVEKRWRIGSCVPNFILSETAIESRTLSHKK